MVFNKLRYLEREIIELRETVKKLEQEIRQKESDIGDLRKELDKYYKMERFHFDDFDLPSNYYESD